MRGYYLVVIKFVWDDKKMFWKYIVVMVLQQSDCFECH